MTFTGSSDFVHTIYLHFTHSAIDICISISSAHHRLQNMDKDPIDESSLIPASVPITESSDFETDINIFLKKKRAQNKVINRLLDKLKENENVKPPHDLS